MWKPSHYSFSLCLCLTWGWHRSVLLRNKIISYEWQKKKDRSDTHNVPLCVLSVRHAAEILKSYVDKKVCKEIFLVSLTSSK